MSEQSYDVHAFELDYACDHPDCDGFMRPTGAHLLSSPPKFPHACCVCGARRTFNVRYPHRTYRRVSACESSDIAARIDERLRELWHHTSVPEAIAEMVKAGLEVIRRGPQHQQTERLSARLLDGSRQRLPSRNRRG